jgi:hypothetical protein
MGINPMLVMHGSEWSSLPFVLNNDGKIPLGNGVVIAKLETYVKTTPKSNWYGYIG